MIKVGDKVRWQRYLGEVFVVLAAHGHYVWLQGEADELFTVSVDACTVLDAHPEFPRVRGKFGELIQISGQIGDHMYLPSHDIPLLIQRLQAVLDNK